MGKSMTVDLNQVLRHGIQEMVFVVKVGTDPLFVYEYFNQAVLERTALHETDLGKTFHEVHTKSTAVLLEEQYKKVLTNKTAIVFDDSYISPQGQQLDTENRLTPLFDESGACTHIVGVVKDVTAEKQAKNSTKEASDRLEAMKRSRK